MESKYLEYKEEILNLFEEEGYGFSTIAQHLIDKYHLKVTKHSLRHRIRDIVKYYLADKEIVEYNIKLSKNNQKQADLNRIKNKSFREHSRVDNALSEYNAEIIKLLKTESLKTSIRKHKSNNKSVLIVHISDPHFNELVDLKHNKYDFKIASKRLQQFA